MSTVSPVGIVFLAVAALWLLHRARRRLVLSRAKQHPSLAGHARRSRRVAALPPQDRYREPRFFGSSLAALSALCMPLTVHAAYVTVRADGIVDTVDADDGLLPIAASFGDSMSILFVIDDVAPPTDGGVPSGWYYGTVSSMTVTVADSMVVIVPPVPTLGLVVVLNDRAGGGSLFDLWSVGAESAPRSSERSYGSQIDVFEIGTSPDLLTREDYFVLASLRAGAEARLFLSAATYNLGQLDRFDQIGAAAQRLSVVPLPATGLLLSASLLGFVAGFKRATKAERQRTSAAERGCSKTLTSYP